MPRRENNRPRLSVHVSFEATRLSGQCLIEAYECLAPSRRRSLRRTRVPPSLPRRPASSRAGKVSMRDPQVALYARVRAINRRTAAPLPVR